MISPQDMKIIQIDITNACVHSCSNCTRFCGHHKKTFMMDFETFKQAVDSLDGFDGIVGMIGGEPTLHPEFERFADYMRKKRVKDPVHHLRQPTDDMLCYIRDHMWHEDGRAGLWSSLNSSYYKNFEVINDTFKTQLLNDHNNTCLHQALLMQRKELGIPDEEWVKKRDACWIQNTWSATITPKGAFFCEVAGSLDMLFDGPGGWKVEPGWWKRQPKDFADQLHWCELCSGCLDVPKRISNDERDDVTPGMLEKLKAIGSPKALKGNCVVLDVEKYKEEKSQFHTFTGANDYMDAGDNQRTSKGNRNLYPKSFAITTRKELPTLLSEEQPKDWVLVAEDKDKAKQAQAYFENVIINPGCIYLYDDVTAFNVHARSLAEALQHPETMMERLWGYYPADKVVPVAPQLPYGKSYVIYGGGDRGKYAMHRLNEEHYRDSNVVGWVDTNYESKGFPVQAPQVLKDLSFEYVILAVEDARARDAMKQRVLELGVEPSKILWTMAIAW